MKEAQIRNISVAEDFSKFPAGRFYSDGPFSGERFRVEILLPALKAAQVVVVNLNGVSGYGSSFLDEAFGGLVREKILSATEFPSRVNLVSADESYIDEINSYVSTK
jgi:hypothetical protein